MIFEASGDVVQPPCDAIGSGEDGGMKLNFWQWLGVALLILGVIWYVMRERGERATTRSALPTSTPALGLAWPINQRL